jgi:hypothetical protein
VLDDWCVGTDGVTFIHRKGKQSKKIKPSILELWGSISLGCRMHVQDELDGVKIKPIRDKL